MLHKHTMLVCNVHCLHTVLYVYVGQKNIYTSQTLIGMYTRHTDCWFDLCEALKKKLENNENIPAQFSESVEPYKHFLSSWKFVFCFDSFCHVCLSICLSLQFFASQFLCQMSNRDCVFFVHESLSLYIPLWFSHVVNEPFIWA